MAVEDDILKELREHNRLMRAEIGLLSEIKFELQNARTLSYKIPIRKPSLWSRARSWFRGKTGI